MIYQLFLNKTGKDIFELMVGTFRHITKLIIHNSFYLGDKKKGEVHSAIQGEAEVCLVIQMENNTILSK